MLHHGAEKVGDELFNFWETQRAFDFDERLDRDAIAVRVCDYKVKACLEWIKKLPKQRGGVVIWFKRTEMGKWMFELLEKAGVDAVLCNASKQGGLNMNNEEYHKSKVMVASISAYKEGINAQGVEYMYFLQMPREAHHLEQCIGRNHRTGTPYDELTYTTNFSNKFDHTMYSAVLADALFQHQAGSNHKAIYGNYDPMPEIVSSSAMKEMGVISSDYGRETMNQLSSMFK
jgi:superfamily II DNA helicase RecQ